MRRYASIITLIILFILTSAAPGFAIDEYKFEGYGYGHGIGMCQWGARGRADSGQTYQQILGHYFQGTQITSGYNVPDFVRVRLFGSSNLSKAYVEGEGSSAFNFIKTDGTYAYQGATGKWAIVPTSAGLLRLIKPDGTVGADNLTGPIIVTNTAGALTVYNASGARHHSYEGTLYIYSTGSASLYLVNRVQFEPYYLYGLGEVPSSWPYQALYAQAVAARSYAIKCMKPQSNFDLYDSVASQVYVGLDKIRETSNGTNWGARWKAAVDNTAAKVITYNGAAIAAYYFSSCGGHTENVELAWPNASPQPYLKGVSDLNSSGRAYCQHEKNTSFSWSVTMSKANFESKLGIADVTRLRPIKLGVSPRILQLEITQANGMKTIMQGGTFRSKLGLKSTWISNMGGTFPDVPLDYWAFAQIENLAERGIITGYTDGTFKPEVAVTRGQFSKMLCVALGIPTESTSTFSDIQGHWAEPYIGAMANLGLVNGYPGGLFKPDKSITRAEISAIISRAMGLSSGSSPAFFPDTVNHWAKADIEIMASNGLVTGYTDGYFRPDLNAKRCEVAVIIYRMFGFVQ